MDLTYRLELRRPTRKSRKRSDTTWKRKRILRLSRMWRAITLLVKANLASPQVRVAMPPEPKEEAKEEVLLATIVMR